MLELSMESKTQKFSIIFFYLFSFCLYIVLLDYHQLSISQMPGIFYILKIEHAEGQKFTFK